MVEEFPKVESGESAERRLIRLLKERGVENPEAKRLLDSWTREQEGEVKKSGDPATAAIEFNLKKARLYFAAGYGDEALESFEAARTQALNENRGEPYQAIMAEMDELEGDSN